MSNPGGKGGKLAKSGKFLIPVKGESPPGEKVAEAAATVDKVVAVGSELAIGTPRTVPITVKA